LDLNELVSADKDGQILPCGIYVDEEGEWFHQGNRIIREDILELFYDGLSLSAHGEYLIEWRGSRCLLEVADTPFVISRVDLTTGTAFRQRILLTLRHLTNAETLEPETLQVGDQNVLYCRIRSGRYSARFSRPAYYQLAEWIQEDPDSKEFYIELNEKKYFIGCSQVKE
jgi:uncharacterized protein